MFWTANLLNPGPTQQPAAVATTTCKDLYWLYIGNVRLALDKNSLILAFSVKTVRRQWWEARFEFPLSQSFLGSSKINNRNEYLSLDLFLQFCARIPVFFVTW